jgi:hypothetical protein
MSNREHDLLENEDSLWRSLGTTTNKKKKRREKPLTLRAQNKNKNKKASPHSNKKIVKPPSSASLVTSSSDDDDELDSIDGLSRDVNHLLLSCSSVQEEEGEEEERMEPETEHLSMDESSSSSGSERVVVVPPVNIQMSAYRPSSVLLNDDEFFTLDDNIVRRTIYRPSLAVHPERYTNSQRVICLNFTQNQFEIGATKWYHLKDQYFQLLCSVFNALEFDTGKKVKVSQAAKAVEESHHKKQKKKRQAGEEDESQVDASTASSSKGASTVQTSIEIEQNNFYQGNSFLCVFIETLINESGKVTGFRLWIFDKYPTKTNEDLLSLGLRESLIEAGLIQERATAQLKVIEKNNSAKAAKAKKGGAKQYDLTKEYAYTHFTSFDMHYLGLLAPYFNYDSRLASSDNAATVGKRYFKDSREFMQKNGNTIVDEGSPQQYSKLDNKRNFARLFSKESAMFYYVSEDAVLESQCRLESYFANAHGGKQNRNSKESAHCRKNLLDPKYDDEDEDDAMEQEAEGAPLPDVADICGTFEDSKFAQFPHPNVTYHLDNICLSAEMITRIALPHRIGSKLYTQKDLVKLKQKANLPLLEEDSFFTKDDALRLAQQMQEEEEDDDESIMYGRRKQQEEAQQQVHYGEKVRYLGIHETELELSSALLLNQLHHIDTVAQDYLKCATIPREVLDKFMANKSNEVHARLKLILNNIGYKKRQVVTETAAAAIAAIEDQRNKSLSNSGLAIGKGPEGRAILDQLSHHSRLDESILKGDIIKLPYISFTRPGLPNNAQKETELNRKAQEYVRRRVVDRRGNQAGEEAMDEETRFAQREYELKEYQSKLASGNVAFFKETIEKYRPFGNSLYTLKTELHNTEVEETFLGRDIFLRLAELNRVAYKNMEAKHYDAMTGQIPKEKEGAFMQDRRELMEAIGVETWTEFFKNPNVSLACEGVRADLSKQRLSYVPPTDREANTDSILGKKTVGMKLPVHEYQQEVRPYTEFRLWVQSLFADQGGITYNYKIISTLYFSKFHHCRWHPQCNSPKLNIILSGTGMAGKSHALQLTKMTLPTSVGDMVTHITDQAFNVDRNMNDMLLIYEEFQNKFLGYSSGGSAASGKSGGGGSGGGSGGGVSAGSDKDTTNFFKARLTSGATMTMSWFENEETGMRDMKISKAHCQGNIFGASNNDFSGADANVMSRFILLSVPKSKNQLEGHRAQDRTKFTFGNDLILNNEVFEHHRELHRVYFLVEQMIKSNVLGENAFGVNVDGGKILTHTILDHLQKHYGIPTGDVRKRDHVIELARCMALSYAVWMGLTSPLTRHLQYDPHDPEKFIGFNPRVIFEGIFPYMVVTKDMAFDAITSLSSLWYHEYQDQILEVFATKECRLQELREGDFMWRSDTEQLPGAKGRSALNSPDSNKWQDFNYIVMKGKDYNAIHERLSLSLGEMVVAPQDICKLFTDLSKARIDNCDGYELVDVVDEYHPENGSVLRKHKALVRAPHNKNESRYIVEIGWCPNAKKYCIGISVHFLKQKLPALFPDAIIEDLNPNQHYRLAHDNNHQEDEIGMQVEFDANDYDSRVRAIGKVNKRSENLITKAIKDVMENAVLENVGLPADKMRELEKSYANPITGKVPWLSYVTADPPKAVKITDFYPELKTDLAKTPDGDAPILFVDELVMLDLTPRVNGKKFIINNYNTLTPSVRASQKRLHEDVVSLSDEPSGEILKKARIKKYSDTTAWELDVDIDSIFCREHLLNIGALKANELPNYPPSTYMNIMAKRDENNKKKPAPLLEYPYVNNVLRLAQQCQKAKGKIDPTTIMYEKFGDFMNANYDNNGSLRHRANSASLILGPTRLNRSLEIEKNDRQELLKSLGL